MDDKKKKLALLKKSLANLTDIAGGRNKSSGGGNPRPEASGRPTGTKACNAIGDGRKKTG